MKLKKKRFTIALIVAFLAIVTGLTVSSNVLNKKQTEQADANSSIVQSTKAIISTSDTDVLEEELNNGSIEYTKIGNTIYVVDYGTAENAKKAVEQYKEVASVSAEEDALFVTAANEGEDVSDTEVSKVTETVPEGMTLREYADSVGKKIVAVIDTGVDPDYAIASKNFTDEDDNDNNGHGTGIAKAILANANDNALILSLKAMHEDGIGYMSEIMQAVQYAREQHVDIINMSIATDASEDKQEFVNLVSQAIADGIKVVASAGNFSSNAMSYYPAGIDGVISVGAAEDNGIKKEFSNYNANYYVNANSTSEAAGIVSGLIANDNDLSGLINSSTMIMDSADKYKEDVKIGDLFVAQTNMVWKFDSDGESTWSGGASYNSNNGTITPSSAGSMSVPNKSGYSSSTWSCGGHTYGNGTASWSAGTTFSGVSFSSIYTGTHGTLTGTTGVISCSFLGGTLNQTTYTVTYQANGGSISKTSDTKTVTPGSSYTVTLPIASRTNWSFNGWYEGSERKGGSGETITLSSGNHTLTANWSAINTSVTFNGNGGRVDGVTSTSVTQQMGSTITKTASHDPYTISLNANGGSVSQSSVSATVTFNGWSRSSGNCSINGNTITYGSQNSTVNAQWSSGKVSWLPTPSRTGYTFNGWWTAASGGTRVDTSTGFTSNQTLYAHWDANKYTLTAYANGSGASMSGNVSGSQGSVTVTYDSTNYYIFGTATRTGYTFEGFYTGNNKNGTKVFASNGYATNDGTYWLNNKWHYTNNLSVYAGWTAHTYTINFDKNQGYVPSGSIETVQGSMSSVSRTYDDGKALPNVGFTWQGHTFLGWSTNKNATSATWGNQSTANITSTDKATVTLYAIWSTNSYTATVVPSEGTWNGSSSNQTVTNKWGTEIDLGQPTPNDKTATITYANIDGADNAKESDTVYWVFKNWTLQSGTHGYFDRTYGTHASSTGKYTYQASNDTITANYYYTTVTLPSPTKEGLTFIGWYKDANFTKKAGNAGETYRAPQTETLYARWEKTTFNYSDTIQAFMQDASGNDTGAYLRKTDDLGNIMTDVDIDGEGFVIGVYEGSISDSKLVLKLDTANGIYDKNGTLTITKDKINEEGFYKIDSLLTDGKTYIVHEISAPTGYFLDIDQSFTYHKNGYNEITVIDTLIRKPPNSKFPKMDRYGRYISGAKFTLTDLTDNVVVADEDNALSTNGAGEFDSEQLLSLCKAGHKYQLQEVGVPDGFLEATPITFTMPTDSTQPMPTIEVSEGIKEASQLKIAKVNSDDEPLQGAKFQLYMKDEDGNMIPCYMDITTHEWVNETKESDTVVKMELETDENGYVVFKNLPLRANFTGDEPDYTKSYYLVETQAPDGFNLLSDPVEIRLPDDGNTEFTYTVKDDTVTLTLEAGGTGANMYYMFGGFAIAIGLLAVGMKKRIRKSK